MTKEQILNKVLEKAIENGYEGGLITKLESGRCVTHCSYVELIFSHDLAKAFFPKGWTVYKNGKWQDCDEKQKFLSDSPFVFPKWQYHLQQMVLEKEPIKYLEKFLKERR